MQVSTSVGVLHAGQHECRCAARRSGQVSTSVEGVQHAGQDECGRCAARRSAQVSTSVGVQHAGQDECRRCAARRSGGQDSECGRSCQHEQKLSACRPADQHTECGSSQAEVVSTNRVSARRPAHRRSCQHTAKVVSTPQGRAQKLSAQKVRCSLKTAGAAWLQVVSTPVSRCSEGLRTGQRGQRGWLLALYSIIKDTRLVVQKFSMQSHVCVKPT
jgi:hypothetical protein